MAFARLRYSTLKIYVALCLATSVAVSPAMAGYAGLVVADNEHASKAGMEMLNRGGNAVDAAIATALALSVVDQAASGLGGGGFMVIYQAKDKKSFALDFRETAPAAARREQYVRDGKPMPSLSLVGALAVGVPGEAAGLAEAHKRFGTLPMSVLAAPAIRLASEGFPIDASLRIPLERLQGTLRKFPDTAQIFLPNDQVPADGHLIRQSDLAESLKAFVIHGPQAFYTGSVGQAIVESVQKAGGVMTLEDLKSYKAVWREPVVGHYRNHKVIGMPPPSSGGVAILQMLNILASYKLDEFQHNSAFYLHLLAEVMKHAFADRAAFLGDPDFVHVPMGKLTSKEYAAWIRARIVPDKTRPPQFYGYYNYNAEKGGTSHFSVIDKFGNAVACTQSVNTRFGSKMVAARTGIVLNNELDDFAIHQESDNSYGLVGNEANSLRPNKRPLSSMSPTIVLNNDKVSLVTGAAGGPRIISATLQSILNIIDFRMPVKEAVGAARVHHQWLPDRLNVEAKVADGVKKALEQRGHALRDQSALGVVQAITVSGMQVNGAADPRKVERARNE